MSFLILSIFLFLFSQVFSSPVLLWSNVNLPQLTAHFGAMSSMNFIEDAICAMNKKQIQLRLIAVQDLNIEDIQRGTQRNHPILFDAKEMKAFRFYPNVIDDIYSKLLLIPQSNNFKCSQTHFKIISSKIYENFEDALNIFQATIETIDQDKPTIIALTSTVSNSRQRRTIKDTSDQILISSDSSCMLRIGQLFYNNLTGTKHNSQTYSLNYNASSCTKTSVNDTTVNLNLVWINTNSSSDILNMLLTTTLGSRFWRLQDAIINSTNHYRYFAYGMHDRMDTPPDYCYVCNSAVFVRYEKNDKLQGGYNFSDKFYLTNFEFQPYQVNNSKFGYPNYCTSFFTSGIWMGLTSSLLCLGILLFGIHRMMTIKSNDRFDDPKGKPLFIKAQE